MAKYSESYRTAAGTNYVIHFDPQPMADGTFAARVLMARHLPDMVEEFEVKVKGNPTFATEQEAAKAGLLAGSQWVTDLG